MIQDQQALLPSPYFYGEVSKPYSHPRITKGFVEFYVRAISVGQGLNSYNKQAELIDEEGAVYSVMLRGSGMFHPGLKANATWKPGDFLLRVDGITMEQAHHMRYIRQKKQR